MELPESHSRVITSRIDSKIICYMKVRTLTRKELAMCKECSGSDWIRDAVEIKHKYYLNRMDEINQVEF